MTKPIKEIKPLSGKHADAFAKAMMLKEAQASIALDDCTCCGTITPDLKKEDKELIMKYLNCDFDEGFRQGKQEAQKDIIIARQCLRFTNLQLNCNNKDCLNESCPLNKKYD